MPVPPLVRRRLRVARRGVLPLLLAPERSDVDVGREITVGKPRRAPPRRSECQTGTTIPPIQGHCAGGTMSRLLLISPFLIVLECRGPGSGGQSAAARFPGGLEGNRPRRAGDSGARGESETPDRALRPRQGRHPGSHHDTPKDDPYTLAWVVPGELRDRAAGQIWFVDLTGLAKVRWRTKQTGFRSVRLTLKLGDGTCWSATTRKVRRWTGTRVSSRSRGFGGDEWTSRPSSKVHGWRIRT